MANITEALQKILSARYGKDVRQSIHDGLKTINEDVADSCTEARKSADSAATSMEGAFSSASSASTSAASALASQNEAKNYFEKTKKMQIASVGNITFSHTEDGLLRASWED